MSKKILYPVSFLCFVLLFYVLSNASINFLIYPFALSMAFALVWSGQKIWIVAPSFLCARLLYDFSLQNIIMTAVVVVFMFMPFIFHAITKKKTKLYGQAIFLAVSQLVNLAFIYNNVEKMIFLAITIIISVLFFLACVKIFNSIRAKGFVYKFTNLELLCGGAIVIAFIGGLTTFAIGKFEFVKLFMSFILLASCYCSKRTTTILISYLLAFGTILPSGNTLYVAPILIWTLVTVLFKSNKKILSSIPCFSARSQNCANRSAMTISTPARPASVNGRGSSPRRISRSDEPPP